MRTPWWSVPGLSVPDVIVSVFSEHPVMLVNDAGMLASNSLICGYLRPNVSADALVASWYTPLTSLQIELQVHALGGGVFVMVPKEISRVRVPHLRHPVPAQRLHRAVARGDHLAARQWGADAVLRRVLGLSSAEIEQIASGRETLMRWRKSSVR